MAMTSESEASTQVLAARNPATGEVIGTVRKTLREDVAGLVQRARQAQVVWSQTSFRDRSAALDRFKLAIARDAEGWARAVRDEIGKPFGEALAEVVSTLDAMRWTIRKGHQALRGTSIGPGHQLALLVPGARQIWRPYGVVGMIGTWNYPLFLNAPTITQAVFAGNGVVWKPSEHAPLLGQKLDEAIAAAGFPDGLVVTVQGEGDVGQALVESPIDKGLFTGGIQNGRHVLTELAKRGIPAIAELSGFDAAIVLPDAPRESAVNALLWAGFVGVGQTCVAVKRVYVVGDPLPWAEALGSRAKELRVGNPASEPVDIGPLISEMARSRFDQTVRRSEAAGARLVTGGRALPGHGWFYAPTVLLADNDEAESVLEGCFGPLMIVRGFATADEALAAANRSQYALAASVWGRDRHEVNRVASRLDAGMVTINDAVTPSALASAPFGGAKASGFGRTRGVLGLREFVYSQTVQSRSPGGFRPHLFPYSDRIIKLLKTYVKWFHGG